MNIFLYSKLTDYLSHLKINNFYIFVHLLINMISINFIKINR